MKSSANERKIVMIDRHEIAAILLVLVSFGFSGCGGSNASLPEDNGRSIAEAFLADVRGGKVDEAWEGTSAEFKSLMGKESFRGYVRRQPALKAEPAFQGAKPVENGPLKLVECTFQADKPKPAVIKIMLAAGPDRWHVERLSIE